MVRFAIARDGLAESLLLDATPARDTYPGGGYPSPKNAVLVREIQNGEEQKTRSAEAYSGHGQVEAPVVRACLRTGISSRHAGDRL